MGDQENHADGGGGQEVRADPGRHRDQVGQQVQGGGLRPEEGQGVREQVHEQRGDHRGVRQEPEADHQDGIRQRAENKLKSIEEELQIVGENMKQLEKSAEKAVEREEKLKDKILQIQQKYKVAEGRFEYGEMNITKLNQRIDDIEDEIYREKLKIKKCADDLNDTFDDMLANY